MATVRIGRHIQCRLKPQADLQYNNFNRCALRITLQHISGVEHKSFQNKVFNKVKAKLRNIKNEENLK